MLQYVRIGATPADEMGHWRRVSPLGSVATPIWAWGMAPAVPPVFRRSMIEFGPVLRCPNKYVCAHVFVHAAICPAISADCSAFRSRRSDPPACDICRAEHTETFTFIT